MDTDARARREAESYWIYRSAARQQAKKWSSVADPAYRAWWNSVCREPRNTRHLVLGCGNGQACYWLATFGATAVGVDVAADALERARRFGTPENGRRCFVRGDAHRLPFSAGAFDRISLQGILHHLDPPTALRELSRVLAPDGRIVMIEPLGHNPAINLYRRLTPDARTADEQPLTRGDVSAIRGMFPGRVSVTHHVLCALAAVPFRSSRLGRPLLWILRGCDRILLALPGMRWWAWIVVITIDERSR